MQIEWGKLLVLLFAIAGAVVLRVTDGIAPEAATGIIMGALGYAFGNGRLAAAGKDPQPLIKRRDPGA